MECIRHRNLGGVRYVIILTLRFGIPKGAWHTFDLTNVKFRLRLRSAQNDIYRVYVMYYFKIGCTFWDSNNLRCCPTGSTPQRSAQNDMYRLYVKYKNNINCTSNNSLYSRKYIQATRSGI